MNKWKCTSTIGQTCDGRRWQVSFDQSRDSTHHGSHGLRNIISSSIHHLQHFSWHFFRKPSTLRWPHSIRVDQLSWDITIFSLTVRVQHILNHIKIDKTSVVFHQIILPSPPTTTGVKQKDIHRQNTQRKDYSPQQLSSTILVMTTGLEHSLDLPCQVYQPVSVNVFFMPWSCCLQQT